MRLILVSLIFLTAHQGVCGQNLVPNPSFEEHTSCPDLAFDGQIINAPPWFQPNIYYGPGGSTDYFNACYIGQDGYGVPLNGWGYQLPKSGDAYAGISPFACYECNSREYIEVELIQELTAGTLYYVSFSVSVAREFGTYATDRIGVYFSNNILEYSSIEGAPILVTPQVENPHGSVIIEDSIWHTISGRFVAAGGEKFLTIGNFYNDDQTTIDTLLPLGSNESGSAYYFIDDVLVIPDSLNSINEIARSEISIYPNPNTGEFTFECDFKSGEHCQLNLYDMTGRKLYSQQITSKQTAVQTKSLTNGIYECVFSINGKRQQTRKMAVIK